MTARKSGKRKQGAATKGGARRRARSAVDEGLQQLEKQLPSNLRAPVRQVRRNLRELQLQLEHARAEREQRWLKLERQVRRDIANLLRRIERAVEPPKASRKKAGAARGKRKASPKKAARKAKPRKAAPRKRAASPRPAAPAQTSAPPATPPTIPPLV